VNDLVELTIENRDGVVVARVTGELDIAGAGTMGESIVEAVPTTATGVVVDFSELSFIDSSGVAMLFDLARKLGNRRQDLRVVAPSASPVSRVLDIVDFGRAAPIEEDLEGALAGIAQ
jgi:anti-anti-sigma factor